MSMISRAVGLARGQGILMTRLVIRGEMASSRHMAGLPPHLEPGPYPKTPEERALAAKKYNIPVEEYEPYPDDGLGFGDYPKIPAINQDANNPWAKYDDSYYRRNYGETLHIEQDNLLRFRADATTPPIIPRWKMALQLGGVLTTMLALVLLFEKYRLVIPIAPKQFPYGIDPDIHPPHIPIDEEKADQKHYVI